jgi:hypothetical protein
MDSYLRFLFPLLDVLNLSVDDFKLFLVLVKDLRSSSTSVDPTMIPLTLVPDVMGLY